MNDYSKKILKVPTVTFVREQDQGKQPVLDVRNLGIDFGGIENEQETIMRLAAQYV